MSSDNHDLFEMDEHLAQLSHVGDSVDDWMVIANAESASALRSLVHESRMTHRAGVIARYHDGEVVGHTAPAHLILRASYEFNDAVVAVANKLVGGTVKTVNDAAREKFGLLIRPLVAGSIQVDFVCPDSTTREDGERPNEVAGQTMPAELDQIKTTTEIALDTVLDVLRAVQGVQSRRELEAKVSGFTPQAWSKLARLANRCIDGDFTIDFRHRTTQDWFSFSPANASALRTFIKSRSLTEEEVTYVGAWYTASKIRPVFDLVTDDGTVISGKVPEELTQESISFIDRRVSVVVAETSDEQEAQVTRKLVKIDEANGEGHLQNELEA